MSALQKAQNIAVKVRNLPDGRIRYYTTEVLSKNPGPTRGASHVTEYNPITGQVRSWHECYDQLGNVNRIPPKTLDGQNLISNHYPLTKLEIEAFQKKMGGFKWCIQKNNLEKI